MDEKVIRCKDCKWFGNIGCSISIVDDSDKPTEDDFCSFAEVNDKVDRKPFTMIFVFKDSFNRIIKIENVKESKTYEGAAYAVTEDETYIIPLNSIAYVKLIKGKEGE